MKTWFVLLLTLVLLLGACSPAATPTPRVVEVTKLVPQISEVTKIAVQTQLVPQVITVTAAPTLPPTNLSYQKGKPFRIILPDLQNAVHRVMQAGFLAACSDLKLMCETVAGNSATLESYIAQMELPAALGSSGVVANFGHPLLYNAAIKNVAAGYPVVQAHSALTQKDIPGLTAWVSGDPALYAKEAARTMSELISCKGKVALMQGSENDTENTLTTVFSQELKRLCPQVQVLPRQLETGDTLKGAAADAAVLTANPDLTGAFSSTGGGPVSWSIALKETGRKPGQVKMLGVDYTMQNLDLITAGWCQGVIAQPIFEEFYKATEIALAKLKGAPFQVDNPMNAPMVLKADTAKYYKMLDAAGIGK